MANKKHQGDRGSRISVRGGEVLQALKLSRNVRGELPNILRCKHAVPRQIMYCKLCLLVAADPKLVGRFVYVRVAALYEHEHELLEVRVLESG